MGGVSPPSRHVSRPSGRGLLSQPHCCIHPRQTQAAMSAIYNVGKCDPNDAHDMERLTELLKTTSLGKLHSRQVPTSYTLASAASHITKASQNSDCRAQS